MGELSLDKLRFRLAGIIHGLRRLYWRFRRPLTFGVKALVINSDGAVLLIKHTYQPGWHFPGGGLDKGETAAEAAERELFEETGLRGVAKSAELVGLYANFGDYSFDHVALYHLREWLPGPFKLCKWEISEAQFFPLSALPPDITPATQRRLDEFQGIRSRDYRW